MKPGTDMRKSSAGITPEELIYNYPSIPAVRIAKYSKTYWGSRALEAVVAVAGDLGMEVIEGKTLNWRKKQRAVAKFRWGLSFYYLYPTSDALRATDSHDRKAT